MTLYRAINTAALSKEPGKISEVVGYNDTEYRISITTAKSFVNDYNHAFVEEKTEYARRTPV
jgi:hypothetical protein